MDLVSKYNVAVPRYTSYPTVPYWSNNPDQAQWAEHIRESFRVSNKEGLSLYIHLPFCESLCTYCACNTRITVNHAVEKPYIEALLREWQMYLEQFDARPLLKELHLGGGTPTFFAPENLYYLVHSILKTCDIASRPDFSFEGHPANTSAAHLQVLYELGFRRLSLGIQDFDPKVQETISRWQTFEEVKTVMETARATGYTSINMDLVYGLPYQTRNTVEDTVRQVLLLKPERIALYSYAHVPWLKPGQRKYTEKELPLASAKRDLYLAARHLLLEAGYCDIGMDHFATKEDELARAYRAGKLHRNFMGYTISHTHLLVGLGCSAISDTWDAFAQNIKTVEEYQQAVNTGKFPIGKGHVLSNEDLRIRRHILNLMCRHRADLGQCLADQVLFNTIIAQLQELEMDGLIRLNGYMILVTETGKQFLRNICLTLDRRYSANEPAPKFSTTA